MSRGDPCGGWHPAPGCRAACAQRVPRGSQGSPTAGAPRVSPLAALPEWTTGSGCFLILQEFSTVGWAVVGFFFVPPSFHSPSLETFRILPLISPYVCPADRWARRG